MCDTPPPPVEPEDPDDNGAAPGKGDKVCSDAYPELCCSDQYLHNCPGWDKVCGDPDSECCKNGKNCDGDITDPTKPINTGGDGSGDSSLDGDNSRENETHEPEVISIVEDDGNSLTIILVVLVCVLIPLVAVLAFVVYLFRKNKKNSVATAMGRRRSSANLRRQYTKHVAKDGDDDGEEDLDAKLEGKSKKINVNIMPGDDEKIPVIPANDQAVMAMFTQVPTDDEIKELLKGKTAKEKRALLKEIEKARQQKIHLEYLLEQQKVKNEERWAMRNVQERAALENLLNNGGDVSAASPIMAQGNTEVVKEEMKEIVEERAQSAD